MWRKYKLTRAVFAGTAAGIILGIFLRLAEQITSLKVYTLLLNIDYVPLLNQLKLSELWEFMLHLVISVLLSVTLAAFLYGKGWSPGRCLSFTVAACAAIGMLLFLTTALSERTPELSDFPALLLWLTGHLLYGLALGWMLREKQRAAS